MPTKMTTHALTGDDVRALRSAAARAQDYLLVMANQTQQGLHGGFGVDDQPDERPPEERRPLQASAALTVFALATVRQLRDRLDSLLDDEAGRYNVGGLHLSIMDEMLRIEFDRAPTAPAYALLNALFSTCIAAGPAREEMQLLDRLMNA